VIYRGINVRDQTAWKRVNDADVSICQYANRLDDNRFDNLFTKRELYISQIKSKQ